MQMSIEWWGSGCSNYPRCNDIKLLENQNGFPLRLLRFNCRIVGSHSNLDSLVNGTSGLVFTCPHVVFGYEHATVCPPPTPSPSSVPLPHPLNQPHLKLIPSNQLLH